MPNITPDQLRDEHVLRREIGRILIPGAWSHRWMDCSPNAPAGDLVIAEPQLLRKVREACDCLGDYTGRMSRACALVMEGAVLATPSEWYGWEATPTDRCIVCIMALGEKGDFR